MPISNRKKHLMITMLAIFTLSLSGCLNKSGGDVDRDADEVDEAAATAPIGTSPTPTPSTPPSLPPGPDPNEVAAAVVNVGVMNFDQINETFSVLTGMDPNRGTIRNIFEDVKTSMPLDNNIKSFSATTQTAVAKLAAQYCFEAIRNNRPTINDSGLSGRAFVSPGFNWNETPTNVSSMERADLVKTLLDNFWQRNPAGAANADDTEFVALFNMLVQGEDNTSTTTRNAGVGVCTAILSNANVIMM